MTTLFPLLSATGADSLRDAARAVDAARADGYMGTWEWILDYAVFPGPKPCTPIILGLDLIEDAGGGDQLEFQLSVVWTDSGQLAVEAAVNVACSDAAVRYGPKAFTNHSALLIDLPVTPRRPSRTMSSSR
ncbi:hypothetical protein [Streptomyces sp. NPDC008001]|uniref:hypothetical protein n=1 Tax=Streptomyces sp. NPDC008001 TaxID=3364804 RepID=UPI0036EF57BF